jgi:repressor LexA
MDTLTQRQKALYDFIVDFRRKHGCSPSIPEMQKAFLIRSPNGVMCHLLALEAKGVIRRSSRGSRQIDIVDEEQAEAESSLYNLPVFEELPAGASAARARSRITLDTEALGFKPAAAGYALRYQGPAEVEAGILPGDLLVVQAPTRGRAGQILVVTGASGAELKRLVRTNGKWFLQGLNGGKAKPRKASEVHGVVRTVVRKLG